MAGRRPLALCIVSVISAESVVVGILALHREGAAAAYLPLHQEIDSRGRVARLHLSRSTDSEQVFVPIVSAIQVVAVLGIPEIDLDAAGPDNAGIPSDDVPSNTPTEAFILAMPALKSPQ
jgi:hypothetical protein